jgi:hypothetical protein
MMTNLEAAAICKAIGHMPEGVLSKTPTKHRFECGCGYVSTFRRTKMDAVDAGILHMRNVAARAVANGVSLPEESRALA